MMIDDQKEYLADMEKWIKIYRDRIQILQKQVIEIKALTEEEMLNHDKKQKDGA